MASKEGITISVTFHGQTEQIGIPTAKWMEGGTCLLFNTLRLAFGIQESVQLQLRRKSSQQESTLKTVRKANDVEQEQVSDSSDSDVAPPPKDTEQATIKSSQRESTLKAERKVNHSEQEEVPDTSDDDLAPPPKDTEQATKEEPDTSDDDLAPPPEVMGANFGGDGRAPMGAIADVSALLYASDGEEFILEELNPIRFVNEVCQSASGPKCPDIHAPIQVQAFTVLGAQYVSVTVCASATSSNRLPLRMLKARIIPLSENVSFVEASPVYEQKSTLCQQTTAFSAGLSMFLTAGVTTAAMVPTATAGGSAGGSMSFSRSSSATRVSEDYETFFAVQQRRTLSVTETMSPEWSLCLTDKGEKALEKTLKNASEKTRLTITKTFSSVWKVDTTKGGTAQFFCLVQGLGSKDSLFKIRKSRQNHGLQKLKFDVECSFNQLRQSKSGVEFSDPLMAKTKPSSVRVGTVTFERFDSQRIDGKFEKRKYEDVAVGDDIGPLIKNIASNGEYGTVKISKRHGRKVFVVRKNTSGNEWVESAKTDPVTITFESTAGPTTEHLVCPWTKETIRIWTLKDFENALHAEHKKTVEGESDSFLKGVADVGALVEAVSKMVGGSSGDYGERLVGFEYKGTSPLLKKFFSVISAAPESDESRQKELKKSDSEDVIEKYTQMTIADVSALVSNAVSPQAGAIMASHEISGRVFLELTTADLIEMKLSVGARKTVLRLIRDAYLSSDVDVSM